VAICKSLNLAIMSTEVRTVPPFHNAPHSRCIGPSSQDLIAAFDRIGTSVHIEDCSESARCSTDAHRDRTIGFRWRKHKGRRWAWSLGIE